MSPKPKMEQALMLLISDIPSYNSPGLMLQYWTYWTEECWKGILTQSMGKITNMGIHVAKF